MRPSRLHDVFRRIALALAAAALFCGCATVKGLFIKPVLLDKFKAVPPASEMGRPTELTSFSSDEIYGRLSPDGLKLVYASNQKGNLDIWLKDLATGIPQRLTTHAAADTMPVFSPDGETIAFVSGRDDVTGDVFLMDSDGDDVEVLTDRSTADAFPVFAPDGKSLFVASGPEGHPRIVRLWLKDKKVEPLSKPGATHPAVSPDGAMLAYVLRNDNGVYDLALQRLADGKAKILSFGGYQCGYPSFSPDGKNLFLVVFYYTQPGQRLEKEENGTVWRIPLAEAWADPKREASRYAVQAASGRTTHLFLQAHASGLVFTTVRSGNLDVWLQPLAGLMPRFDSAADQLAFALGQEDPYDQLFALREVRNFPGAEEEQQAYYESARIDREKGWYDKQFNNLEKLDAFETAQGDWQGLARVDLAVWEAEKTKGLEVATGQRLERAQVEAALAGLDAVEARYSDHRRVSAYVLLRRGDMQRLLGDDAKAIAAYERVTRDYAEQREEGVEAKVRLGQIFARLRTVDLQVAYYLTLFAEYPEFEKWLLVTIDAIAAEHRKQISEDPEIQVLVNPPEFNADRKRYPEEWRKAQISKGERMADERLVRALRRIIDRYPQYPLLGATLQIKIGRLYEAMDRLDLAIQAMETVAVSYLDHRREVTEATFALGRYAMTLSSRLRAEGRFVEAGAYYAGALQNYEQLTHLYPRGHTNYERARREYIALALLKALQEEMENDRAVAKKSYADVIRFEPNAVQAHRRLIYFGVQDGRFDELEKTYEEMIDADAGSFVGHYGLGYLYTWKKSLSEGDLDDAEELLQTAVGLDAQSPYPYLTLGWIYEMRERYFGDFVSGWLEEAVDAYAEAYSLNDRGDDLRTEADVLHNLGNVFSQLGNTWKYAYDYFRERESLGMTFLDPRQEAVYHLNFGRAAFNLNRYEEASDHFEAALVVARALKNRVLEAEIIARLALNYQQQGNYDTSTRFFEQSMKTFTEVGQTNALAALTRSVALNFMALGDRAAAVAKLNAALALLDQYGTRPTGEFIRLAIGPDLSLSPMGFDSRREREVNAALRDLILEDLKQFAAAKAKLDEKYALMDELLAAAGGKDPDTLREMSVVNNRRGRMAAQFGGSALAFQYFRLADVQREIVQSKEYDENAPELKAAEGQTDRELLIARTDEGERLYLLTKDDFAVQMENAVAGAEVVLRDLVAERPIAEALIVDAAGRLDF
ncbi:MAG: hypothetical protein C4523_08605, partial [Myxococcales bacterium]